MSNNLSKLLVPSRIDLLVERALGIHQLVEGPVLDDVPGVEVQWFPVFSNFLLSARAALYWACC